MDFVNNSALIILEVLEPNKPSDLRYITVGVSDTHKSDSEFAASATAYFKQESHYPDGTRFVLKGVQRFNSLETYLMFFENQFADYLESLK